MLAQQLGATQLVSPGNFPLDPAAMASLLVAKPVQMAKSASLFLSLLAAPRVKAVKSHKTDFAAPTVPLERTLCLVKTLALSPPQARIPRL